MVRDIFYNFVGYGAEFLWLFPCRLQLTQFPLFNCLLLNTSAHFSLHLHNNISGGREDYGGVVFFDFGIYYFPEKRFSKKLIYNEWHDYILLYSSETEAAPEEDMTTQEIQFEL